MVPRAINFGFSLKTGTYFILFNSMLYYVKKMKNIKKMKKNEKKLNFFHFFGD